MKSRYFSCHAQTNQIQPTLRQEQVSRSRGLAGYSTLIVDMSTSNSSRRLHASVSLDGRDGGGCHGRCRLHTSPPRRQRPRGHFWRRSTRGDGWRTPLAVTIARGSVAVRGGQGTRGLSPLRGAAAAALLAAAGNHPVLATMVFGYVFWYAEGGTGCEATLHWRAGHPHRAHR